MIQVLRLICCWLILGANFVFAQPQHSLPDSVLDTALGAIGLTQMDLSIRGNTLGDLDRFELTKNMLQDPVSALHALPRYDDVTGGGLLTDAFFMMHNKKPDMAGFGRGQVNRLDALVSVIKTCKDRLDVVYGHLSDDERLALAKLIRVVDPGVLLSEAQSDSLLALGRRVNREVVLQVALDLMDAVTDFVAQAPALEPGIWEMAIGQVVVGGYGTDVYADDVVLIIDLGGDDHYHYAEGISKLSVVIDMGGNDKHFGAVGSGIGGVQVVVDVSGNDIYQSDGVGQGVGIGGVGVLVDMGGDDVYRSGVGGQGFGLFGVGLVCDVTGDDEYNGGFLVQGVGAPGGVGILADRSGDDHYWAGGKYKDFREEGQYDQSMAQGVGYGVRPLASGGIGVLIDGAGDDRYEVSYFGQGVGFWGSVGVLIDRQGQDEYKARRYAQGCGVHLAVGLLLDETGDDRYDIWGVGQGLGHDLAVGRLIDRWGNDVYRATWLAQGVGNANGVGWLDDMGGDDLYEAVQENTQGFGMRARDYGSIGLLIDRAGKDRFRNRIGTVRPSGDYGILLDWPIRFGAHP